MNWPELPLPYEQDFENKVRNTLDTWRKNCSSIDNEISQARSGYLTLKDYLDYLKDRMTSEEIVAELSREAKSARDEAVDAKNTALNVENEVVNIKNELQEMLDDWQKSEDGKKFEKVVAPDETEINIGVLPDSPIIIVCWDYNEGGYTDFSSYSDDRIYGDGRATQIIPEVEGDYLSGIKVFLPSAGSNTKMRRILISL